MNYENDIEMLDIKNQFQSFLDSKEFNYGDMISTMIEEKKYRVMINLNDLRSHDNTLASHLLNEPLKYMKCMIDALSEIVKQNNPEHINPSNGSTKQIHVGFEGSFGSHYRTPRNLMANLLCKLVCVDGIVTKCSLVRPKLVTSVQYCPKKNQLQAPMHYHDGTSLTGEPTSTILLKEDADGNKLEMEFGLSTYKDHQTITIQEMPEIAPLGQLPRSIDIILDHDLVDRCKPGDRVQISGIYRPISNASQLKGSGQTQATGNFKTSIIANSVKLMSKEVHGIVMCPADINNIRKLAEDKEIQPLEIISKSLAPSIYGHDYLKKALVLQQLGGCEKNLANGTHIRGDINVLVVGDPSCGKSQLLRCILNIAPLAINTTGKGSSGVGLTAAVTFDKDTGEKRLEAGAMVLADRGTVCIDEFDKMGDQDRVAIHEVMEQQTVTIAKAGIHTTLNARCSVLAAANPVYGQYNKAKRPQENVGLPDSLLSRFDLLFIVTDSLDSEQDRRISDHVLRMHRYCRPGYEGVPVPLNATKYDDEDDEDKEKEAREGTAVYEKSNPLLHAPVLDPETGISEYPKILTVDFIKKYIHFAKMRFTPELSDDARCEIENLFVELREAAKDSRERTLPVTARQLETVIRLSSAHAKIRLSPIIEKIDTDIAKEIIMYAMFHEIKSKKKEPKESKDPMDVKEGKDNAGDEDDEDDDEDDDNNKRDNFSQDSESAQSSEIDSEDRMDQNDDDGGNSRTKRKDKKRGVSKEKNTRPVKRSRILNKKKENKEEEDDENLEHKEEEEEKVEDSVVYDLTDLKSPRILHIIKSITLCEKEHHEESYSISQLMPYINNGSLPPYTEKEVKALLTAYTEVHDTHMLDGDLVIIC